MERKAVSGIMLTLMLTGILTLAFNIQSAKASGTIYIRANGVVEGTDNIQRDGDYYTFTDNIYESIVIERDNIVVDGVGYTLQGTASGTGIDLSYRKNVTIKNMEIRLFYYGIKLAYSLSNSISGNNLKTNYISGIELWESSSNSISGNDITERHSFGIKLDQSSNNNTISGNDITENGWGIKLSSSNNNTISGNNVAANEQDSIEVFYSSNNSIYGNNIANSQKLGIMLSGSSNYNSIKGNNISNNGFGGIRLHSSLKNSVSGNNITDHTYGCAIKLEYSLNYTISGNNIANNFWGISFGYSSNYNRIYTNNITNNDYGIGLSSSSFNSIFHNNFVNNGVLTTLPYLVNAWDDGYPSGGNYWSDYSTRYPGAQELDDSGIWDTPYVINVNNQDNYPLMEPWSPAPPIPTTIDELKTKIEELSSQGEIDNQGIVKSLICKLNTVQKLVDKEKIDEATKVLEDFITQVQELSGIHITVEAADILIKSAEYILSQL